MTALGAARVLASAVVLASVGGCVVEPLSSPIPLFPQGPDQPVVMPRAAVSIEAALHLAHRQCGLRWAAVSGTIGRPGGGSIGPFNVGQKVALTDLLDRVADAAGTEWRWKRQMAVFGPSGRAEVRQLARLRGRTPLRRAEARNLGQGSVRDRRWTAARLADGQWPEAVTPLLSAAGDSGPQSRSTAIGDPGDPAVRWAAFTALARIEADCVRHQPPGRWPVLAVMLDEPPDGIEPPERVGTSGWRAAVVALGAARASSAESAIRGALDQCGPDQRAAAVWALGQIGDDDSVPACRRLLLAAGEPLAVRSEAAFALARIGTATAINALVWTCRAADATTRMLSAEALGWSELNAPVAALAPMVNDASPRVALAAADALGRIGSESACKALSRLLLNDSAAIRRLAAAGLARAGRPIARELLVVAAGDSDGSVRAAVADSLGWLGGRSANAALMKLIADPAPSVRAAAIAAVARIGTDEGRQVVESWLTDRKLSLGLKISAVIGLGQSRHPAAIAILEQMAGRGRFDRLAYHACLALARIGETSARRSLARLMTSPRCPRLAILAAGWARANGAIYDLSAMLSGGGNAERTCAAAALACLSDPSALGAVIRQGAQPNPVANRLLFDAAAHSRVPNAARLLADAAHSHAFKPLAAVALGAYPDPRAADVLLELLNDNDAQVRRLAAASLGALGDPSALGPLVRAAREDRNLSVSAEAVRALRAWNPADATVEGLFDELSGGERDFGIPPAARRSPNKQPANSWVLRCWSDDPRGGAVGSAIPTHRDWGPLPPMSYESTMVYDPATRRVLQWGGHGRRIDGPPPGQTWAYDPAGGSWQRVGRAGDEPIGSGGARQMVYDADRQAAVAIHWHGGQRGWQFDRRRGLCLSLPWVFDSGQDRWRAMRPVGGPPIRGWTQCAYDSEHQVVIVFGGLSPESGRSLGDVWAYDPHTNTWARLDAAAGGDRGDSPGPQSGAACAYDPVAGRMLVIGPGSGGRGRSAAVTWAYDIRTGRWEDLKADDPPPSFVGPMVYDSIHDAFIALEDRINAGPRVHVYHPRQNRWETPPTVNPRPRYGIIDAAFDPGNNLVVVSGGMTGWQTGAPTVRETWTYRYAEAGRRARGAAAGRPSGLHARVLKDRTVRLTWSRPAGRARGFQVFRGSAATDDAAPWRVRLEPVPDGQPVAATHWHDREPMPEGTLRYYCVAAVDADGRVGPPGPFVRTQPARPIDLAASPPDAGKVELTWPPNAEPDVIGYNVYRARARGNNPWSAAFLEEGFGPFARLNDEPLAETAFTDAVVGATQPAEADQPPPVFGYVVRAVNQADVESGPSPVALALAAPPRAVQAHRRPDGSTLVSWQAPRSGGAGRRGGWFVFRMDGFDGDFVLRQHGHPLVQTAWIDPVGDPEGIRRRYYIVPADSAGRLGIPSAGAWSFGRP